MPYPNLEQLSDDTINIELVRISTNANNAIRDMLSEIDYNKLHLLYAKTNRILLDIIELRVEKNTRI